MAGQIILILHQIKCTKNQMVRRTKCIGIFFQLQPFEQDGLLSETLGDGNIFTNLSKI